MIDEAGIEVHVGGHALIDLALVGDDLGSQAFHTGVELIFIGAALFPREGLHKAAQDVGAGVGEGVDCVAHAVDEAGVVECLAVEEGRAGGL